VYLMKNVIVLLAALGLLVTACSPSASTRTEPSAGGAMQPVVELAVGTLKLDGTADAITKEQAAELLPLWEVYKEIGSSDTAAQQEIEALTAQIQAAMTEAQLQSIGAMKLTQEDVMELVRQQFPSMSAGSTNGGGPVFGNGGPPSGGPPGGFPGGDLPADASGGPAGGLPGGAPTSGTPPANSERSPAGFRAAIPVPLVNAVIEYLKEKAAS
jgi:hypothetical protein